MQGNRKHMHRVTRVRPVAATTTLLIVLETILDTLAIVAVRQRQAAWKTPFGQFIPSLPGDPILQFPVDGGGGGGGGGVE